MKFILFSLILTTVTIFSCSKDSTNNTPAVTQVYLKSYSASNGDTKTYFYDAQKRMAQISGDGSIGINVVSFIYNGNSNQVTEMYVRYGSPVGSATKYTYAYDAQGKIIRSDIYDSTSVVGYTQRMYWTISYNGSIQKTQQVNPNGSLASYYETTKNSDGNVTLFEQFTVAGVKNYREDRLTFDNKVSPEYMLPAAYYNNLVGRNNTLTATIYPSGSGGSYSLAPTYEYNADGYTTKVVISGTTYNYIYERR